MMNKHRKILITGGTGFIGAHYVRHLMRKGDMQVVFSGRHAEKSRELEKTGAVFKPGDLTDTRYVDSLCEGVDTIIHSAGLVGVWGPYNVYFKANVVATYNLIAASRKKHVTRFINFSSPSIYFDYKDHLNVSEEYLPKRIIGNYARSKFYAEKIVTEAHSKKLKTISLRPRMVIGPGDNQIIPRLMAMSRQGKLKRVGDGQNVISMTSIDNLMAALDCCVFGPERITGHIYNICDPEPVNFWDIANFVLKEVGYPVIKRSVPFAAAYAVAALTEAMHTILRIKEEPRFTRLKLAVLARSMTLNIEKAQRLLGYHPVTTIEKTARDFCQWWRASPSQKR